jgi:hypothetical protein
LQAHAKRMKANFCVQKLDSDAEPRECRFGGHGNEHQPHASAEEMAKGYIGALYVSQ